METMDEGLAAVPENAHVRKIHECVNRIKSSEEIDPFDGKKPITYSASFLKI